MSASPSGRPAAASIFCGSAGENSPGSVSAAVGSVTMAWSAAIVPLRRFDLEPLAAVIDAAHRAIQHDRQACAVGLDRRAESFGDAPVHVVFPVFRQVARRDAVELGAAVIRADRIEQRVPPAVRLEIGRRRAVAVVLAWPRRGARRIRAALAGIRAVRRAGNRSPATAAPRAAASCRSCGLAAARSRSRDCARPNAASRSRGPWQIRALWTVNARPPSRVRASTIRQATPASCRRRAAATPAAPPPMIATSVSLLAMPDYLVTGRVCCSGLTASRQPLIEGRP